MEQEEIQLTDVEAAPINMLGAQIDQLTHQRNGMILYLANLKGVSNSGVEVRGNRLVVTPCPEKDKK